jgi:hypothetical protein
MHYDCILFLFTYLMVDPFLVQYFGHYPGGFNPLLLALERGAHVAFL